MDEVIIFGSVLPGGKISTAVSPEYQQFLKENAGEKIAVTITVISDRGNIRQKTYYEKVVLPCLIQGFRETGEVMNKKNADEWAKAVCPATNKRKKIRGEWVDDIIPEDQMTAKQWSELIEGTVRFCNMELEISVPEPEKR